MLADRPVTNSLVTFRLDPRGESYLVSISAAGRQDLVLPYESSVSSLRRARTEAVGTLTKVKGDISDAMDKAGYVADWSAIRQAFRDLDDLAFSLLAGLLGRNQDWLGEAIRYIGDSVPEFTVGTGGPPLADLICTPDTFLPIELLRVSPDLLPEDITNVSQLEQASRAFLGFRAATRTSVASVFFN